LFQQQHDSREFLQSLLIELKSDSSETSHAKLYSHLNHLLSEAATTRGRVIVVVDEAQNLEDPVLETLRQLSNFETARSKLLQIVLAGQPQLARKLARREQVQLRQRISTIARLSPLLLDETRTYLNHRLSIAGYRGPEFFTSAALQLIWSRSHGIPRNINTLCFNAMLLALAQGIKRVDELAIKEAAQDLDLEFVLADVAGVHQPSDGFEDLGPTAGIGVHAEKPTRPQQSAVFQSAANNSHRPSIAEPVSGRIPGSRTVVAGDRKPVSDGPKPGAQQPAVLKSESDGRRQSITKPNTNSCSIGIGERHVTSDEQKHRNQEPAVVPVSSNQHSQPSLTMLSQGSRMSNGKKLLWVSLLAAAAGAGVLFGHGLGDRVKQSGEERPDSLSRPQRTQDPQSVLDAPLTPSRKDNDKESNSDVDDGPEIAVRAFPQSVPAVPGSAQENSKAIFFDGDSAEVSSRYNITLQRVAEILTATPQSNAIIEGYTDNSGDESYNLDLSMRRAVAVRDILVKQYQIAAARLSTIGAGSSAPLESNSTSSGRAYNRRVEMRIMQPEAILAAGSDPK
jgi:outer membrane protein OmpA-like peptidoglycan-associated protein